LDPAGDFYVADTLNNVVRMVNLVLDSIATVAGDGTCCYGGDGGPAVAAQLNSPLGVTLDALGNLYVADTYNFRVRQVSAAGAPLNFPPTGVGGISVSQNVTVTNIGNQPLTFANLTTNTANFVVDASTTTCLLTISTLQPGGTCVVGIDFTPQGTGPLTDTLTITDNSLNNGNALQVVQLSGIGGSVSPAATATTLTGPSNGAYGKAIIFSAAVSSSGGAPAGTVAFLDGASIVGTATLSSGKASFTSNALVPGTHSIVAQYQGSQTFSASTSSALGVSISAQQLKVQAFGTPPPIYPGQQGTVQLLVSASGPVAAVTLTCSGLPLGATCAFSPDTATNLPTNVTMTIFASATVAERIESHRPESVTRERLFAGLRLAAGSFGLLLPGFWLLPGVRRKSRRGRRAVWFEFGRMQ
jgi:hypothetical protein